MSKHILMSLDPTDQDPGAVTSVNSTASRQGQGLESFFCVLR